MKGKPTIVNTMSDFQKSDLTMEFIEKQAEQTIKVDVQTYPENYDQNLKEGEDGYIPPIFEEKTITDENVLKRFGVVINS